VPETSPAPAGAIAALAREIPSTHRPDRTLVFVPERHAERLARARRSRRWLVIAAVSLLLSAVTGFSLWRVRVHQAEQARLKRREVLAERELDRFAKALELFHVDVGRYPTSAEGLTALLRRPETLAGWRGPYIDGDYSLDPWGNDYIYRAFNEAASYELLTYGPEGEAAKEPLLRIQSDAQRKATAPDQ
jgi:general secretion pathway protein G